MMKLFRIALVALLCPILTLGQVADSVGFPETMKKPEILPSAPIIYGVKFCEVSYDEKEMFIKRFRSKEDDTKLYSFPVNVENDFKRLHETTNEVTGILFQVNDNGSRQISLIFRNGIITAYIDDDELKRCKKTGDLVNTPISTLGCPDDGNMAQWKAGSDGTLLGIGSGQVFGIANTTPRMSFAFDYIGGEIKQIIVKDNVRVITVGNDLLLIAPDFAYKCIRTYDGGTVFVPIVVPDGRIIMSTQKNLIIYKTDGKVTELAWSKVMLGLEDLENVEMHLSNNFVEIISINFKLEDGTPYKVLINLDTMILSASLVE